MSIGKIFNSVSAISISNRRSYKNFGHKKEPIPTFTTLWHGFLTFSFVGMCINWDRIGTWIFGENQKKKDESDWDSNENS